MEQALSTFINSPLSTSYMYPYIGILDGTNGWFLRRVTSSVTVFSILSIG